jgi:hypothetical protein
MEGYHKEEKREGEASSSTRRSPWGEKSDGLANQHSEKARKQLQHAIKVPTDKYLRSVLSSEFLVSNDFDWKGELLAYVAQMIRSNIEGSVYDTEAVVAAALILDQGEYKFVIGINVHANFLNAVSQILKSVPKTICGIEVLVAADHENDLNKIATLENALGAKFSSRETKGVPLPEDTNVWSWHAEQKVLTFIKLKFPGARKTVHALGIAHILGPCTEDTAGRGVNYCAEFLWRKNVKCTRGGRDPDLNVAAYWYNVRPGPECCSIDYLRRAGIEVTFAQ